MASRDTNFDLDDVKERAIFDCRGRTTIYALILIVSGFVLSAVSIYELVSVSIISRLYEIDSPLISELGRDPAGTIRIFTGILMIVIFTGIAHSIADDITKKEFSSLSELRIPRDGEFRDRIILRVENTLKYEIPLKLYKPKIYETCIIIDFKSYTVIVGLLMYLLGAVLSAFLPTIFVWEDILSS